MDFALEEDGKAQRVIALRPSILPLKFATWRLVYGFIFLLLTAMGLFAAFRPRVSARGGGLPARVVFAARSMEVFDEQGQMLGTHRFNGRVTTETIGADVPAVNSAKIADFRGDGEQEVLAVVPLQTDINVASANRWEVDMFSRRGELLWSYVPQRTFQFGKYEISGAWAILAFFVSTGPSPTSIWIAVGDRVWGNSFVVNLDAVTGKDTLRFVNTGVIHSMAEYRGPGTTFLIIGGFNNEEDMGSLAIMNEDKPFAASPQSVGSRHKCESCAAGDPDYYFVFPRSEINELSQVHENGVLQVDVIKEQIQIRKSEMRLRRNDPQTLYVLTADHGFRVISVRYESAYDMLHRKLEAEGQLDHNLENCPERLHPRPIRVWTPARGWAEVRLGPIRWNE